MGIRAEKRMDAIRQQIVAEGKVSVPELVRSFGVSEVTVRRYLAALERRGVLVRTYGGAVKSEAGFSADFLFNEKLERHTAEKQAIARACMELIGEDEIIFLDTGTTTLEIARCLREANVAVTVVTNSLPATTELMGAQRVKILLIGGFLRRELLDFHGQFTQREITQVSFHQSFLGVDGISVGCGLSTTDIATAQVEEAVIQRSQAVNIVADSSKIGRVSLIAYGNVGELKKTKRLITDRRAPRNEVEGLRRAGFEIIQVKLP